MSPRTIPLECFEDMMTPMGERRFLNFARVTSQPAQARNEPEISPCSHTSKSVLYSMTYHDNLVGVSGLRKETNRVVSSDLQFKRKGKGKSSALAPLV